MDEEIKIDEVNDLYVTQVTGKLTYHLYRVGEKQPIHSHMRHIYDESITSPITVYTMVKEYVNKLKNTPKTKNTGSPCPCCEKGHLVATCEAFKTTAEGKAITVPKVEMERCDHCGEDWLTPTGSQHVDDYIEHMDEEIAISIKVRINYYSKSDTNEIYCDDHTFATLDDAEAFCDLLPYATKNQMIAYGVHSSIESIESIKIFEVKTKMTEKKYIPFECNHKWSHVYNQFDDGGNPTGRCCSRCNKQQWYKSTIITHIPQDMG